MRSSLVQNLAKILEIPFFYDAFQSAIGSFSYRELYLKKLQEQIRNRNVLDIGCGTASYLEEFIEFKKYIGLDASENYISKCRQKYLNGESDRIEFYNFIVGKDTLELNDSFKNNMCGLGMGIFHHLSDESILNFFESFFKKDNSNNRAIYSLDPVVDEQSSAIAKFVAYNDRGEFIRTPEEYENLVQPLGLKIEYKISRNKFRIPLDLLEMKIYSC